MEGEAKMCTACNLAANEEGKCPGCGTDVMGSCQTSGECKSGECKTAEGGEAGAGCKSA